MTSSPVEHGLKGSCPARGEGRLFSGFLKLARSCEARGQSFERLMLTRCDIIIEPNSAKGLGAS